MKPTQPQKPHSSPVLKPLRGVRVGSLALNLPGPAALLRLKAMGATCVKVEPPGRGAPSGDPMAGYSSAAYKAMHEGIKVTTLDLKSENDQATLHRELARCNVLLTSFRPSALNKLRLGWQTLRSRHPALSVVSIVGAPGAAAEEPGHDLTYLAEAGLLTGLDLPPTLFADMGGALMASEAVLKAVLQQKLQGKSSFQEIALSEAADWLALPRVWGLTQHKGMVGGAHAGYRMYACIDGRVAVAALESHFSAALCAEAGISVTESAGMLSASTHSSLEAFFAKKTCDQLNKLAMAKDIPLHTLVDRPQ